MKCLFCSIAKKEIPAEVVYEDDEILGFKNIKPEAPVHLLFIFKKHIEWEDELEKQKIPLFDKLISVAKKIAIEKNIFQACKFIFNVGQTGHIPHIHLHLLGGWQEEIPMYNV